MYIYTYLKYGENTNTLHRKIDTIDTNKTSDETIIISVRSKEANPNLPDRKRQEIENYLQKNKFHPKTKNYVSE